MKFRRIVIEAPPGTTYERALTERDRCRATINLDGTLYRCGRGHVDGIHDALARHSDDGLVRW